MSKYKLVLFDLDGTLIDTDKLIFMSYKHVLNKYRSDYKVSFDEMIDFLGPTLMDTFKVYFPGMDHDEIIEEYREYNVSHHRKFVNAFKGAESTLKELRELGIHVGVVTSKRKDVADFGLQEFGLDKYCEILVDCDDVKNFKPHPEGILKAIEHFKAQPNETLMVGDSKSDMMAGMNAGCDVAAVSYSIKGAFYEGLNVNYIIDELLDILKIVKGD
mgnify:CR=1 FL=1